MSDNLEISWVPAVYMNWDFYLVIVVMIIDCRPISPSTSADTCDLRLASLHGVATPLIVMAYSATKETHPHR
jgi:hypothetical protein